MSSNIRGIEGKLPIGMTGGTSIDPVIIGGLDPTNLVRTAQVSQTGAISIGNSPICASLNDTFESYNIIDNWTEVAKASGDLITLDGNSLGCSYLVMSLDPLSEGTSSYIETKEFWTAPVRMGLMFGTSQRTVGQDISFEFVSTDVVETAFTQKTISSIQQTTTTVTITTTIPHELKVGDRVSISGVIDSRLNYTSLIVSSVTSPTIFLGTVNGSITIASASIGPFSSGVVNLRSVFSYNIDGTSLVLDNATTTNASFFSKSGSHGQWATGNIGGSSTITVTTTASTQLASSAGNYCFSAPTLTEMIFQPESLEWVDKAVDSSVVFNTRIHKEKCTPNFNKSYKLRINARNNYGVTRPIAQIVSATKSGSTTATIITDVPHGLSTTDYVNIYGIRDTTNFANLTTATIVASIVNSTTFTIVIPTVATATSYGGYISRCNGAIVQQGTVTMAAQSISRISNVVSVVGSATWTGIVIGDYINLIGIRDNSTGASLSLDGSYRVNNILTTTLVLEPIGSAPTGADVISTNCGGAVLKRTDLRIDFIRISPFTRNIVETYGGMGRSSVANSLPVIITSNASNNQVAGAAAASSAVSGNPVYIAGKAFNTIDTTIANSDTSPLNTGLGGQLIVKPYSIPENELYVMDTITNSTTPVQIKALTASYYTVLTTLSLQHGTLGASTIFELRTTPVASTTATIASNTLVMAATYGWKVGDKVKVTANSGTVTGLTVGVTAYILSVSSASLTFSLTRGGSILTIAGTTVSVTLTKILFSTELQTTALPLTNITLNSPSSGLGLSVDAITNTGVTGNICFNVGGYISI